MDEVYRLYIFFHHKPAPRSSQTTALHFAGHRPRVPPRHRYDIEASALARRRRLPRCSSMACLPLTRCSPALFRSIVRWWLCGLACCCVLCCTQNDRSMSRRPFETARTATIFVRFSNGVEWTSGVSSQLGVYVLSAVRCLGDSHGQGLRTFVCADKI